MSEIDVQKAKRIVKSIIEFEKEYEKDESNNDNDATKRVRKILEDEINAIEIHEAD